MVEQVVNNEALAGNGNVKELNETVSRLLSHQGVESVQILNQKGDVLVGKSTILAQKTATLLAAAQDFMNTASETAESSSSAKNDDADGGNSSNNSDEVKFLKLLTENGRELMIVPHGGSGYSMAVLSKNSSSGAGTNTNLSA